MGHRSKPVPLRQPKVDTKHNMSGHGHSHGGCGHEHSHDDKTDAERGNEFSLYLKIDTERVQCLNEALEGSGKDVFKPWDKRLDTEKVLYRSRSRSRL